MIDRSIRSVDLFAGCLVSQPALGLGGQVYFGCHLDGWMLFYFSATVTLLAVLT